MIRRHCDRGIAQRNLKNGKQDEKRKENVAE
jgi:hypothetical protein